MSERTRWGVISTSIHPESRVVTQAITRKGVTTETEFNSPDEAHEVLAESQEWSRLAAQTFTLLGRSILAVTAYNEIRSLRTKKRLSTGRTLAGGFLWAVSHLASDTFQGRADFAGLRSEHILFVEYREELGKANKPTPSPVK